MLYIFDKDNTLIFSYPSRPAQMTTEQVLLSGVVEKCRELRRDGNILAIASNQGGIASNKVSLDSVEAMMSQVANWISASAYRFCPHSSRVNECDCRKPLPGMILSLMAEFDAQPENVVFVGDADGDKRAAEAAGIKFIWATEFFGWPENFNTILEEN